MVLQQGVTALAADAGIVFGVDQDRRELVQLVAHGYPAGAAERFPRIPLDAQLPAPEAVRTCKTVHVASAEELYARYPALTLRPSLTAAVSCIPLALHGRALAVLVLSFATARRFTEGEITFMTALGNVGALALDRAIGSEVERRARERAALLARASQILAQRYDSDVTLRELADLIVPDYADWCVLQLLTDQGRRVAANHADPSLAQIVTALERREVARDPNQGGSARVLATGKSELHEEIPDALLERAAADPEELELLRKMGMRSALVVPMLARGRPLGTITLVSTREGRRYDATDLEVAEELGRSVGLAIDNARLHAEAQATQKRLSGILESAMDAIITIDEQQRIVLFNAAAETLFGLGADEVIGRRVSTLIPPRFHDAHARHVERFGQTGETRRSMGSLGTLWGVRADGSEFPVEATISKLADRDQTLFTVILRDVTDRLAKERELEDAARHKDEFLAMLGHELRNPLAAITSAIEVSAALLPDPEPELGRARDVVGRQVKHMVRLVDDLLDVSRIARGKVALRDDVVDLALVVRTVVEDHRAAARQADVTVVADAPGQIWVRGDEARLVQVVGNIVNNALKFTDAGGEVAVTAKCADGVCEVTVRDNGIGMEAETIDRLFEPFRQAEASLARTRGGLGLGLAVARGIVELHGGTLVASSDGPGSGSTFVMRIPLTEAASERPAPRAASSGLPFERFLVVEDNEDAATLLAELLRFAGARVWIAADADSALRIAREERPEVLLCDIGLPDGRDGYSVARAVREDRDLGDTILVAVSGYGLPEDVERSRASGFHAHLTKPVRMARLRSVLEELAGERGAA